LNPSECLIDQPPSFDGPTRTYPTEMSFANKLVANTIATKLSNNFLIVSPSEKLIKQEHSTNAPKGSVSRYPLYPLHTPERNNEAQSHTHYSTKGMQT